MVAFSVFFFCPVSPNHLRALEDSLPGITFGRHKQHGPVIAYADDESVSFIHPGAFTTIQQVVQTYERATRIRLIPHKTKALVVGLWIETPTFLGISLHD
jgi:hypothetical protein